MSQMHIKETTKQRGLGGECADGAFAQESLPAEHGEQMPHQGGANLKAAVNFLIFPEVARRQAIRQKRGVLKTQIEAFTGYGVNGARGVSHEHDIAAVNALEAMGRRDGSAFRAQGVRVAASSGNLLAMIGARIPGFSERTTTQTSASPTGVT